METTCFAESPTKPFEVRDLTVLGPGQSALRANATEYGSFFYYAESDDEAIWSGPYIELMEALKFRTHAGIGVPMRV